MTTARRPPKPPPLLSSVRINARLPPEAARKLAYLQRATGGSATEVLLASIDRSYDAQRSAEGSTADLLRRAGFVGGGEGPADLSETYKAALSASLAKKT